MLTVIIKKQCFSTLPFGLGKKCSTVPETPLTLDTIQSGGFNGEVTILPSNVYQKSQITLYAINPDIYSIAVAERTVDDLEQINNIDSYSQVYKNQLQPWFK